MKKFLLLLALCSLPVYATDWQEMDYKQYIDYDSWDYSNGIASVWFKDLNPGDWELRNNKKIWYRLARIQFNCLTKEYDLKSVINYDTTGKVINSYNSTFADWDIIPPGTIIDNKRRYVCGGK